MKKIILYVWAGFYGFINSYVPLFSMLGSFSAAFTLSIFFPPTMLIVFGLAVFAAIGVSAYHIRKMRQARSAASENEKLLHFALGKKNQLKQEIKNEQEAILHLYELIEHAFSSKQKVQIAYDYVDALFNKVIRFTHEERIAFAKTALFQEILALLPNLKDIDLPESEFAEKVKQLQETMASILTPTEIENLSRQHAAMLPSHSLLGPATPPKTAGLDEPSSPTNKVSLAASIGIGIKSSILLFGLSLSFVALGTAAFLGLAPVAIITAAPAAVIFVSTAIATASVAIGSVLGITYHKVVAPQQQHDEAVGTHLININKNNNRLEEKKNEKIEVLKNQQVILHEIESDNIQLRKTLGHEAEELHKKLDSAYHQSKKIGVKNALTIAAHEQIKSHEVKPNPAQIAKQISATTEFPISSAIENAVSRAPSTPEITLSPDSSSPTEKFLSAFQQLTDAERQTLLGELQKKSPPTPGPPTPAKD